MTVPIHLRNHFSNRRWQSDIYLILDRSRWMASHVICRRYH
jgi:hypothetical protein